MVFFEKELSMPLSDNHLEKFLKDLTFFKGMQESDIYDFLKKSNVKQYKKNQPIFLHGDEADRFIIVVNGWVKLHRETPEGEEAIIELLTRGDVLGEAAIFGNAKYPFSAHVTEESQLIEIPSKVLKEQARSNPKIMERLMTAMSDEIDQLQLEKEHMALMSTPQRVGCLLLQLSAGMQGKGGTFTFPYDKSIAATRLGMKAETFSRALAQLKPLGVTVKGSEITINNFECLINYSCGHCSKNPDECRKSKCCSHNCREDKLESS